MARGAEGQRGSGAQDLSGTAIAAGLATVAATLDGTPVSDGQTIDPLCSALLDPIAYRKVVEPDIDEPGQAVDCQLRGGQRHPADV